MAGGSGTRFWPFSTPEKPKQFLDLTGEGSMLQLTLERLTGLVSPDNIWIITGEKYRQLVQDQCPQLSDRQIVGEPMARDTSGAIALGAGLIHAKDPDAIMAVLPADHVIRDREGFQKSLSQAVELAEQDRFVTIGIPPTYPAEVYGYLQRGDSLNKGWELKSFVEKPSKEKAETYLSSGDYYWNAGMFVWKSTAILNALHQHLPEHAAMAEQLGACAGEPDWQEKAETLFQPLPKVSIDYGLMEKLNDIAMVEATFDWNDVGGWLALEDLLGQDNAQNTLQGCNVVRDVHNNIIITQHDHRPSLVVGISDCIVVNAEAGTLVCHRNDIERIKDLIEVITHS